jgi:very-short-patch-repair endonuclease
MRTIIKKTNSTKPERILAEQLKSNHIPFRHRVKILGYEADFLIRDKLIVEIGNHKGNPIKNGLFLSNGYSVYTFSNQQVPQCINQIIKWQEHRV